MDKGDYELFVVDGPTSWGRPKLNGNMYLTVNYVKISAYITKHQKYLKIQKL